MSFPSEARRWRRLPAAFLPGFLLASPSSCARAVDSLSRVLEQRASLVLAVLVACFLPYWSMQVTDSRATGDGVATTRMAVNLAHHGLLSSETGPTPRETMYREPVPAVTASAGVLLADALLGRAPTTEDYLYGARARFLKYHHVLWKALAVAGGYALIVALGGPHAAALGGALLLATRRDVDTLNTELEAGALLVAAVAALVLGLHRRRTAPLAAAGALFGLAALTKAAVLYVFGALLVAVALVLWLVPGPHGRRERPRHIAAAAAVLAAAFCAVTAPWMARNYAKLGEFQISSRAGVVLFLRAVHDRMTWEEYRGAFYVWSRPGLKPIISALTGFDDDDLALGGRLQRLNRGGEFDKADRAAELAGRPEDTLTYYRFARAERVRLVDEHTGAIDPRAAERAADRELASRSLASFRAAPFKHLAMSLPFAWRGAAIYVPALLIALVFALRLGRRELLVVALFAGGWIAFHALLTHFETRYSAPLKPLMGALVIVLAVDAWRALARRAS